MEVGPLIDDAAVEKVQELVATPRSRRPVLTGVSASTDRSLLPPTVLAGVRSACTHLHEEIFGPVAPITTFTGDDEAIEAPTTRSTASSRTRSRGT